MKPHTLPKLCLIAVAAAAALPAAAEILSWETQLLGSLENPSNASPGTGSALVSIDTVSRVMTIDVTFANLVATTSAGAPSGTTAAHIHCCVAAPGNVGVATYPGTFPGFPAGVRSGTYLNSFDLDLASSFTAAFVTNFGGGTLDGAYNALVAGMNNSTAYFNIHSTAFPGGEIRGFLQPVPEPSTYALMVAGLGLVGWMARRRRG